MWPPGLYIEQEIITNEEENINTGYKNEVKLSFRSSMLKKHWKSPIFCWLQSAAKLNLWTVESLILKNCILPANYSAFHDMLNAAKGFQLIVWIN